MYKKNCAIKILALVVSLLLAVSFSPVPSMALEDDQIAFSNFFGSGGDGDGQFSIVSNASPAHMAIDSSGNFYVVDPNNCRVEKFNSSGVFIKSWGSKGTEDGQFLYPYGITVDNSTNIYVTDWSGHTVQKFSSDGTFIVKYGSNGSSAGQFIGPTDITHDSAGNFYVLDSQNNRIQMFNYSFEYVSEIDDIEGYSHALGIYCDESNNIYVADQNENEVKKYDSNGILVLTISDTHIIGPADVCTDSSGNIYVASKGNSSIVKYNSSGTYLYTFSSLSSVNHVSIAADGTIYASCGGTHTIMKSGQRRNNSFLSGLAVTGYSLDNTFDKNRFTYNVNVGEDISSVTITPTAEDSGASINIRNTIVASAASTSIELSYGINRTLINVTSPDSSTKKQYLININRASPPGTYYANAIESTSIDYTTSGAIDYWSDECDYPGWYNSTKDFSAMKFDLSGYSGDVGDAKLNFYYYMETQLSTPFPINVYGASDDSWEEGSSFPTDSSLSDIILNDADIVTSAAIASPVLKTIDVTGFVKSQLESDSSKIVTFVIKSSMEDPGPDIISYMCMYGDEANNIKLIPKIIITTADTTSPSATNLSPVNGATNAGANDDLIMHFNEKVNRGTGNITIYKASDDSQVEVIDVTGTKVTGSGTDTITINPTTTFEEATGYYVKVDATAIKDTSDNYYPGINDKSIWHFNTKDLTAPTGYTVNINQTQINSTNKDSCSFTFAGAEVGATYNYSITGSSGAPVTGSGIIVTASDIVSGIDVSGLGDGTLTLSAILTDTSGNTGSAATDIVNKDTTAPTGYTVNINQTQINSTNKDSCSFTFAGAEVEATYNYSITGSSGEPVTGSGIITTASHTVSDIDVSGLGDGTLTLSAILIDTSGNTGSATTDTVSKDATAPTGYTVNINQTQINSTNKDSCSFTFAGAEVGATYNYSITGSSGAPVTGSGIIVTASDIVSGIDVSGLGDGTLTLSVILTDTSGNIGSAATDTVSKDTALPVITLLFPIDDSKVADKDANLVITFGENITAGTGNFIIYKASDDSVVESISVTSSAISFNGNNVTVNPSVSLGYNTDYYITISGAAIKDMAGNSYSGIIDKTTWNFKTSSAPPPPPPPPPPPSTPRNTDSQPYTTLSDGSQVIIDIGQHRFADSNVAENNGVKTTVVTLDDNAINTNLDTMDKTKKDNELIKVVIPVNNNSDKVVGILGGQTVKNMESKDAILEIKTENVTYSLPASDINIDSVLSTLGGQVQLKDIKVNISVAPPSSNTATIVADTAKKNNYTVVVKPVEFEITCSSGSNTVEVLKFNAYVERTIAIPDGIDPSKITTGVVLNKDGSFSHVPTTVIAIDGKYYAKINSLTNSTYSVIWNPKTYSDIINHWAKIEIEDMASRLIINGTSESKFDPDKQITRGEFSDIIVKALGLKRTGTGKNVFKDVKFSHMYYDSISIAYEYGILLGDGKGKCSPDSKITREEAMIILSRAMKIIGVDVKLTKEDTDKVLSKFIDGWNVNVQSRSTIAVCIKEGILAGNAKKLDLSGKITRAQTAIVISRMLKKFGLI